MHNLKGGEENFLSTNLFNTEIAQQKNVKFKSKANIFLGLGPPQKMISVV